MRRASSYSTWRAMSRLRQGSAGVARRQAFLECPDAPHLRFVLVEAGGHLSDELLWRVTEHPRHRGNAQRNHARPIDHQNRVIALLRQPWGPCVRNFRTGWLQV